MHLPDKFEWKSAAPLKRNLEPIEILWKEIYIAAVLKYTGDLRIEILEHAFKLLQSRHKVLQGAIRYDETGYLVEASTENFAEFSHFYGDEVDVKLELRSRPNYQDALCRLILAEYGGGGCLALQGSHAVFDSSFLFAMLSELWELYADLNDGREIRYDVRKHLPLPPSSALGAIWTHDELDEIEKALRRHEKLSLGLTPPDLNSVVPDLIPYNSRIRLTPEKTSQLRDSVRKLGTSLHAIICGVISVALRGQENPSEMIRVVCTTMVDARSRLTPPLGATDTANVNFPVKSAVAIDANADLAKIGHETKAQLESGILKRLGTLGDAICTPTTEADLAADNPKSIEFLIGNAGIVRMFRHPDGVTLEDLRLMNDVIHPFVTDMAMPQFIASTFNEQLAIEGLFPRRLYQEAKVDEISHSISANLEKFASLRNT